MFNFLKKKEDQFASPVDGKLIKLEDVRDDVFAQKMMGDGFAVIPFSNTKSVVSPADSTVIMVAKTKHAIGLKTKNNLEILVHIGIDTVNLKGKGFTAKVHQGQSVKIGQPLIDLDMNFLIQQGYDMTVIVVFTKGYDKSIKLNKPYNSNVSAGEILIS